MELTKNLWNLYVPTAQSNQKNDKSKNMIAKVTYKTTQNVYQKVPMESKSQMLHLAVIFRYTPCSMN